MPHISGLHLFLALFVCALPCLGDKLSYQWKIEQLKCTAEIARLPQKSPNQISGNVARVTFRNFRTTLSTFTPGPLSQRTDGELLPNTSTQWFRHLRFSPGENGEVKIEEMGRLISLFQVDVQFADKFSTLVSTPVYQARFIEGDWNSLISGGSIRLELTPESMKLWMEKETALINNFLDSCSPVIARELKRQGKNMVHSFDFSLDVKTPVQFYTQNGKLFEQGPKMQLDLEMSLLD